MSAAVTRLPVRWLENWQPNEAVPVSIETVRNAIAQHEAALMPADIRAVAVELDRVLAVHGTPADWEGKVDDYLEAFEGVPLDLVQKACKNARLNLKFFPKPAELRAPILDELAERRHALRRLRTAEVKAAPRLPEPPRQRTPEEIAAAAAMVEAVSKLDAAPKAMPTDRSDLRPEDDDRRAAILRVQQETRAFKRIPKPWEQPQ
ncbi:hypothetical protein [Azospirillum sp. TSA6c]|uniref:hypothetical protein n=1 Tax=Azospirillum sp. TSA6c TaxID=709813 RepID=UPI0011B77CDD|nr:hypothetical protein [Azospirillum sp. TSA6c]